MNDSRKGQPPPMPDCAHHLELAFLRHELTHPLVSLVMDLKLIRDSVEAAPAARAQGPTLDIIEQAQESARHMIEVVRAIGVVDVSNDDGSVNLVEVVRAALRIADVELRRCARVTTDFRVEAKVVGSRTRLRQIVLNLLWNAILAVKEVDPMYRKINVRIASDDRGWVTLTVEDTGAGIASLDLHRILEPHFTTRPESGSGLGLTVCKTIIEAWGGALAIESTLGAGTTVRVSLPVAR